MRWFRKCRLRFQSLFDRSRLEIDLEDELRDYIDHEIERGIAAGSSPEEARTLAVSTLRGAERLKEECRDARGVRWLEDSLSDLRFVVRTLRKAPAFTTTVIAALAFCIGVNTAIFSVVDTALFRPLPFPNQGRLVSVSEGVPSLGFPVLPFSTPDYLFVAAHNRSFAATGTYRTQSYEISGTGQPRRVYGARLTASLFRVLGVSPAIGRAFTQNENEHAEKVAVLNYGFAQNVFGTPRKALGRTIFLDRIPYTVIGIMPRSFSFPIRGAQFNSDPAELFVPVSWTAEDRQQNVSNFDYSMIGRLRPNVTIREAKADMRGLLKRVVEDYPEKMSHALQQHVPKFSLESQIVPFSEQFTGNVQRPLLLLLAAVGIVLLIGCADVANLMFSRMVGRRREFALRAALGAGNWRLVRQTLTEGLVLSVVGGAIGFCLAFWVLPLLIRFAPDNLPRLNEVGLNWRMAAFVVTVTLATPLVFCLGPLTSTIRSGLVNQLRGEGRTNTRSRHQRLAMSAAVVVQFSLAFVLLTTAGLLARSFIRATEANPGFQPGHVTSTRIVLPTAVYKTPAQITGFFNRLLVRLSMLPGVRQTGAVSDVPINSTSNVIISIEGQGSDTERVDMIFCRGNALEALRVPLLRGRLLQPGDNLRKQQVAVISDSLAKRIWRNRDRIGQRIRFGVDIPNNNEPWLTVVGIVADVKARLTSNAPRLLLFTTPDDWVNQMNVIVRTAGNPLSLASAIRHEIGRIDPSLPAGRIETLDQVLDDSLSSERFRTWLLASFAAAALLLAMLGIAGLLAFNAAQRTQEFGVRIALGATRRDLLTLMFRHCLRLSGVGIGVGLAASIFVTRVLSSLLYDTSPLDPGTFVAVASILMLFALGAAVVPAWRVVHTDPIIALRAE
ncbi:MAG TPA: ABC transporter permease [Bryobacteraceae bacterium]|nr:ABC transporter permease [Bryobacteraceae bacterium]